MEKITIKQIRKEDRKISILFEVTDSLKRYFYTDLFYAEYSESIDCVPESIAVIPFLTQILPIAWILDVEIVVKELDKDFYNSIPSFKMGYINMYPALTFKGELKVDRIVSNSTGTQNKSGAFFSGGLDAFATLIAHVDEKPLLILVHGADIRTSNQAGWDIVLRQNTATAKIFGTELVYVKSNFTEFLNQKELNSLVWSVKENWWHGFQHGIGLIGLGAPISYVNGLNVIYIAASHTANDNVTCASDPSIDNFVRFSDCSISHDQYECNRLDKTRNICNYVTRNHLSVFLRVCFRAESGNNCCNCEKCLRTAAGIEILGYDPKDFGFYKNEIFRWSHMKVARQISPSAIPLWDDLKNESANNNRGVQLPNSLKWITCCNLEKEHSSLFIRTLNFICRKAPIVDRLISKI